MSYYQGRALEREPRRRREPSGPGGQLVRVLAIGLLLVFVSLLPWRELRRQYAVITHLEVRGLRYLTRERIVRDAGLREGQDLLGLDLDRARRGLLKDPRVKTASVERAWLRGVRVRIEERVPALLVRHGVPWELDETGVLLPPLQPGVVADVPMLTGPDVERLVAGTPVRSPEVQRGLAWVAALSENALRMAGQVSEVDVSEPRETSLLMLDGTRVRATAWPPGARKLSSLRVTLADLQSKGLQGGELDLRFENQVIVRDAQPIVPPAIAARAEKS